MGTYLNVWQWGLFDTQGSKRFSTTLLFQDELFRYESHLKISENLKIPFEAFFFKHTVETSLKKTTKVFWTFLFLAEMCFHTNLQLKIHLLLKVSTSWPQSTLMKWCFICNLSSRRDQRGQESSVYLPPLPACSAEPAPLCSSSGFYPEPL